MKSLLIGALLHASGYGIVESVRETPVIDQRAGLPGVFEHAAKPPTADEVLVRLDDGQAIVVVLSGMQLFEPGQRVLVVLGRQGARVEHADVHAPV